jgi:DNA topoisomerase 2-associated protein PAT1
MSGHNPAAPGFSQSHDPFADLSKYDDDMDALNFEDTYDGLGDQLDETDDAFNDDTFGGDVGGISRPAPIGKDFDFFGSTAMVADAIEEEHVRFHRQQPAPKAAVPAPPFINAPNTSYSQHNYAPPARAVRTGYEKYRDPEPTADLQIDASIWGTAPKKAVSPAVTGQNQHAPSAAPGRKIMSLEEVEAAMRTSKPAVTQPVQSHIQPQQQQPSFTSGPPDAQQQSQQYGQDSMDYRYQQPESQGQTLPAHDRRQASQAQTGGPHGHPITILQRPSSKHAAPGVPSPLSQQQHQPPPNIAPTQILQNPNRLSGDAARMGVPSQQGHRSQNSSSRQTQAAAQPAQLGNLSEQDKAAFMEAEVRRAKRNHKIHVLSRDNGLMTPHDKSFITRIQLQQLVSATGDPAEYGTDAALAEDFYYQVHSSLKAARPNPNQPLNNFAQTYLFQTGNRHGARRHGRGPENHMQRMEQQVLRAVEAAKNKPKNKQLVIEGSLGKISFSNAKTPKPLLNIKRTESSGDANRPASSHRNTTVPSINDRKVALRAIEDVYMTLMKMEDHERTMPPPPNGAPDQEFLERQAEWQTIAEKLNVQLWDALKVHEPVGASEIHPFIAFLSYPKGKKAIPRVFRQLSHEQRTTILTLIIVHLDQLDVVHGAQVQSGEPINISAAMRESIEAFSMAVMPCLFNLLNDTELHIVTAVLSIIIQKLNIDTISRTRIGISMLTMILSRAEIIKQSGLANEQSWQQW